MNINAVYTMRWKALASPKSKKARLDFAKKHLNGLHSSEKKKKKKEVYIYIYGQIQSRLTCTIQMGVWRRETALLNILWQECGLWYAAVEGWGQVCVL